MATKRYPPVAVGDGSFCTAGPECRLHGDRHQLLQDVTAHIQANPYAAYKPNEVDTKLADIYAEYYESQMELIPLHQQLTRAEKRLDPKNAWYREADVPSLKSAISIIKGKARAIQDKGAEIMRKTEPYEAEYQRRGGWTRAFLVDNTGGHVHKSRNCSKCYPTTQFVWLPEQSGKKESEIVEAAGKMACTECYPSAPVDVLKRPGTIRNPLKAAAQDERAAARAAKATADAEKAITDVDGSVLKTRLDGSIKTARAAEIRAVELHSMLMAHESGKYVIRNDDFVLDLKDDSETLLLALANKKGTTRDEELEYLKKKAAAKFKRDYKW